MTKSGLLTPRAVATGTAMLFGLAALIGVYLVSVGGLPILIIGLLSILAGVGYTVNPYPLAYIGLGDAFAFLFFGVVATWATLAHTGSTRPAGDRRVRARGLPRHEHHHGQQPAGHPDG